MVTGAGAPSDAKLKRLTARDERVWRGADGYVTITNGLKSELERRFGNRAHVEVVPDGVRPPSPLRGFGETGRHVTDDQESSVPPGAVPSMFTIGYAGHLYPWKGVDLVIEAIASLQDARGLIIGGHDKEADLARVKALAEERFCSLRILFTGMLPPPDVAAKLRDADVLVLPNPPSALSQAFTSPLKLFEYMASGRPIVASDLPSFREVLTDGANALLFEAGNPQALTAAIRRIKEDPALGRRLAAQALADVRDYSWARRAEKLESLFAQVLG
jgi:glycosyltransferase involved in cell wall biosynthesis